NGSINNLPTATWHGRRFILKDFISKKGHRGRTSWIKSKGLFVREILEDNKLGEVFWVCRRCDERGDSVKPFKASATSSAIDHLRRRHRIIEGTSLQSSTSSESDDPPPKRLRTIFASKASVQALQELAVGFIIEKNVPFTILESKCLRRFLQQLNPDLFNSLSLGRTSLRDNLDRIYQIKRKEVKKELYNTITKIHIGFDLWTSPNRISIIAVTAYYINSNAMGILNLVGRAFLYGEDNEAFEEESQLLEVTGRFDDELKHWRKKGTIGKLRNIIKFTRSSTHQVNGSNTPPWH
ncbi:hypothetical protein ACQKWADRAFT_306056, partial [Trichoderma austrokoningii]